MNKEETNSNALTIYFDESGFTGYNLLDTNQPFFTVASSSIEPKVAEELMRKALPNYMAEEFKFNNIVGSKNQRALKSLWINLQSYHNDIFLYAVNKKFVSFLKVVDFLVEPNITKAGYDFYADDFCRKYANFLYCAFKYISKQDLYDSVVVAYSKFSRDPSIESLETLMSELKYIYDKAEFEVKPFVGELFTGAKNLPNNSDMDSFKSTNDIQLTVMLAIIGHWRQKNKEDFIVKHDSSSNFLRNRELWDTITRTDAPAWIHPISNGGSVEFPLRVIETQSVDSKDNYSIQLCDLIAGFACQLVRLKSTNITDHPIIEIATESGFENIMCNMISPGSEFPEFPPKRLVGLDAIDRFMLHIKK
jgi:hypothetical protein